MKRDVKKLVDAQERRRKAIPEGGVKAEGKSLEQWHKALRMLDLTAKEPE